MAVNTFHLDTVYKAIRFQIRDDDNNDYYENDRHNRVNRLARIERETLPRVSFFLSFQRNRGRAYT